MRSRAEPGLTVKVMSVQSRRCDDVKGTRSIAALTETPHKPSASIVAWETNETYAIARTVIKLGNEQILCIVTRE